MHVVPYHCYGPSELVSCETQRTVQKKLIKYKTGIAAPRTISSAEIECNCLLQLKYKARDWLQRFLKQSLIGVVHLFLLPTVRWNGMFVTVGAFV